MKSADRQFLEWTISALILVSAFMQAGCRTKTFTEVRRDRAGLVNGIESYQSVREFKVFAAQKSLNIYSEDVGNPATGNRPPFNLVSLIVKNFIHLGCDGQLTVIFFNDRLIKILFDPANPQKYNDALQSAGIVFDANGKAKGGPFVEIYKPSDRQTVCSKRKLTGSKRSPKAHNS